MYPASTVTAYRLLFAKSPPAIIRTTMVTTIRIMDSRAFLVSVTPTTQARRNVPIICMISVTAAGCFVSSEDNPTPSAHFFPNTFGEYQSPPRKKATAAPTTTAIQFTFAVNSSITLAPYIVRRIFTLILSEWHFETKPRWFLPVLDLS